ncbi:tetrahydromethanopterin S-methyltransferase subunit H [Halobacteriaceae archaeon GCM10025711]
MFTFEAEQEVYDINGVKIGGQPGEHPTAMVGSIFYKGDPILEDPKTGEFDEEGAREAIRKVEELSEETGNPAILDVIGDSPEALIKHVDFVAEESDLPMFVDGPTPSIRAAATRHVGEVGLQDRAIYNSMESSTKEAEKEIEAMQEAGIEAAVLLSIDTRNLTLQGRFDALEKNLEMAEKAGVEKTLVDPAVIDIPDAGFAAKAIYEIKDRYGIPAGCSPHNEVVRWGQTGEMSDRSKALRQAVANSVIEFLGADFNLYGTIHSAEDMYAVVSQADAYVGYAAQMGEQRRPPSDHPLFKIYRKGGQ